jgi:Winged helix-turn helix
MRLAFGIIYHPSHVSRLLQAIRWSQQKPVRRARQRDETAIMRWQEETWPALEKGHKPRGKPSSSSMNPGSIPCPVSSAPMPR